MPTYCPVTKSFAIVFDVSPCSAKLMSVWITVVIAFQRMLAITAFQKVAIISTPNRARLLLSALCLVCTAVTAYPIWTVGSEKTGGMQSACIIISESYDEWLIVTFVIGSLVLPEVLLIVCTSIIIYHLARSRRLHQQVGNAALMASCSYSTLKFTKGSKHCWQQTCGWSPCNTVLAEKCRKKRCEFSLINLPKVEEDFHLPIRFFSFARLDIEVF